MTATKRHHIFRLGYVEKVEADDFSRLAKQTTSRCADGACFEIANILPESEGKVGKEITRKIPGASCGQTSNEGRPRDVDNR